MNDAAADKSRLLAISAIGPARDQLELEFLQEILDRGCYLVECRTTPLATVTSIHCLVGGNWSVLAKLESVLPALADKLGLSLRYEQTVRDPGLQQYRPYAVEVIAPQRPDLLTRMLGFFREHALRLGEITLQNFHSSQTGAAMSNLQLVVLVPINDQPQSLREAFMDLCDDLNADGLLDPIKN